MIELRPCCRVSEPPEMDAWELRCECGHCLHVDDQRSAEFEAVWHHDPANRWQCRTPVHLQDLSRYRTPQRTVLDG